MLEILYLEHAATGTRILPTPPCYCPHPDTAKDLSLNLAAHVDARLMPPNNKAPRPSFKMFPRFQPSSFPANASSNKPRIHFFISARSRAYDAPSYLSRSWRSKLAELGYPPLPFQALLYPPFPKKSRFAMDCQSQALEVALLHACVGGEGHSLGVGR